MIEQIAFPLAVEATEQGANFYIIIILLFLAALIIYVAVSKPETVQQAR